MRQPVAVGARCGGGAGPAVALAGRPQTARAACAAPRECCDCDMRHAERHERQGLLLTGPAHECEFVSLSGTGRLPPAASHFA